MENVYYDLRITSTVLPRMLHPSDLTNRLITRDAHALVAFGLPRACDPRLHPFRGAHFTWLLQKLKPAWRPPAERRAPRYLAHSLRVTPYLVARRRVCRATRAGPVRVCVAHADSTAVFSVPTAQPMILNTRARHRGAHTIASRHAVLQRAFSSGVAPQLKSVRRSIP